MASGPHRDSLKMYLHYNEDSSLTYVYLSIGNPVSAYVCSLLFVIRALRVSCGVRGPWARMRVRLAHAHNLDPRPEYARAALAMSADGDMPTATLLGSQVCTDQHHLDP